MWRAGSGVPEAVLPQTSSQPASGPHQHRLALEGSSRCMPYLLQASQPAGGPCLYPRSPRHHGSHFHNRSGHLSVSTFAFPCPLVPVLLPLPFFMSHLDGTTAHSLAAHPKASAPSLFETLQANSPCRIPNSGCKPEPGAQVCGCPRDKFINSKRLRQQYISQKTTHDTGIPTEAHSRVPR